MVCQKLADMSRLVVGHDSAETHLPQDDPDSQDQTIVVKPSHLKTPANASGGDFNSDSSYTGKDSGTNWHMVLATNSKFIFELEIR